MCIMQVDSSTSNVRLSACLSLQTVNQSTHPSLSLCVIAYLSDWLSARLNGHEYCLVAMRCYCEELR